MHQRRNASGPTHSSTTASSYHSTSLNGHSSSSSTLFNNNNNNNNNNTNTMHMGRRGVLSSGYDPERGRLTASEMNTNIMEEQNNDRIAELSEQVSRLKGLTIDIGNEVREQNSLLDQMGDGFMSTSDLLHGSLRRIGSMLERGGAKHMCYMVAFIVVVMVVLYWMMKMKR